MSCDEKKLIWRYWGVIVKQEVRLLYVLFSNLVVLYVSVKLEIL